MTITILPDQKDNVRKQYKLGDKRIGQPGQFGYAIFAEKRLPNGEKQKCAVKVKKFFFYISSRNLIGQLVGYSKSAIR